MIGEYTIAEVWNLGQYFTIALVCMFYCWILWWAITRLKTGKDARAWCKEYRDKPQYDWVADVALIGAMLYILWVKVCNRNGVEEQDVFTCPKCGGYADNGFDRCLPPNPYYCSKCQEELDE